MITLIQNDIKENSLNKECFGKFLIEPLEIGQAVTLGNSIRRTLISDISGFAITIARINNIKHEFSAIRGAREDVIEVLFNLREIIFKENEKDKKKDIMYSFAYIKKEGPCVVTAGCLNFFTSNTFLKIVNPDQYICTIVDKVTFYLEIYIEKGRGYSCLNTEKPIIPFGLKIDSLFLPIKRVNYKTILIHDIKGNIKESLILEILTNGSISPSRALEESLKILMDLIYPLFISIDINIPKKKNKLLSFIDNKVVKNN
jgi:DNA-directed RNA polymerase subunit alpha